MADQTRTSKQFTEACTDGDIGLVKYLARSIFEKELITGYQNSCRSGHLRIVKYLVNNYDFDIHAEGERGFAAACMNGHIHVIEYLLGLTGLKTINIRANGLWGFALACKNGHNNVIKLFSSLECDRKITPEDINSSDDLTSHHFTAACEGGNLETVKLLMKLFNPRINLEWALHRACISCNPDLVSYLLNDVQQYQSDWNAYWNVRSMIEHSGCDELREVIEVLKKVSWKRRGINPDTKKVIIRSIGDIFILMMFVILAFMLVSKSDAREK